MSFNIKTVFDLRYTEPDLTVSKEDIESEGGSIYFEEKGNDWDEY